MAENRDRRSGVDWPAQKLKVVSAYLHDFTRTVSKAGRPLVLIDAFSGTGYRGQRERQVMSYGSVFDDLDELIEPDPQQFLADFPMIPLGVAPPFERLIYIQREKEMAEALEQLKSGHPQGSPAIEIHYSPAACDILEVCQAWDKRCRGLLFLDPVGMETHWEAIHAIADTGCIDLCVFFPFAANRVLTRFPDDIRIAWEARLTHFFGTEEWEMACYKAKTYVDIFGDDKRVVEKYLMREGAGAFYHSRLKSAFPHVAPEDAIMKTGDGRPLFQIFFATAQKEREGEIALQIAHELLDDI